MDIVLLTITLAIQVIAVVMVIYTFYRISERQFPKLAALERYHLMRKRYEHLRWSLLFVGALIAIQLFGVIVYVRSGTLPVAQVLISDVIVIALTILLSRIYKERSRLQDMDLGEEIKQEKPAKK